MAADIYSFLERTSPFLIVWSFCFTLVHAARIAHRVRCGIRKVPDNAGLTELAGLPLTLLQSVAFVMAAQRLDWLSMLLFAWWGPGFIAIALIVIVARRKQRRIDWHRYRLWISFLCKGHYLAYMAAFVVHQMPGMTFAFSAWIINDQYEKAFMSLDADRSRRTFDDGWLFRCLYPAGLMVPLLVGGMPLRPFTAIYGGLLLGLWAGGLIYVARQRAFFRLPADPSLLRNMVYFPALRVTDADAGGKL